MHQMTRDTPGAVVRAPFRGEFQFKGDLVELTERGAERFMHLRSARDGEATYRITRVVGGRHREDFVGIQVPSIERPAPARGEERVMPISYVFSTETWRYKGYSVMVKERRGISVGGVWRQNCVFCHNTVPYVSYLYDELLGARAGGYQGSMTNDLMPPSRRFGATPTDAVGLGQALQAELAFLGDPAAAEPEVETDGDLSRVLRSAIVQTRERFGPEHFVETGIGCESCHGGSKEHVLDPSLSPSIAVRSPLLREHVGKDAREPSPAEAVNRSCMHCHTVLFSRYAHTWEGGHRRKNPGGSNINSGEARDFMLGGCASEMSCVNCHDPHARDSSEALAALRTTAGNSKCTSCHTELAPPKALAAHSHHKPEGAGAACIACHMPQKNLALDYRLTAYHRIGSPTDRERVEQDRPLECSLCHVEKSVGALVRDMERWWGKRYQPRALSRLYGNLNANPLSVTLRYGLPHEQAVAASVLGSAGKREHSALIGEQLSHAYPLVRYFAAQALSDLWGGWPAVELDGERALIEAQTAAWLKQQSVELPK